jgi:hypothetical protein
MAKVTAFLLALAFLTFSSAFAYAEQATGAGGQAGAPGLKMKAPGETTKDHAPGQVKKQPPSSGGGDSPPAGGDSGGGICPAFICEDDPVEVHIP